jgi:hypothetical protein
MNCPYCNRYITKYSFSNGYSIIDFNCRDVEHSFYYNQNTFFLRILNKDIEVGKDYIGYYIITSNGILNISPFELNDCVTVSERYIKLLVFS